MKSLLAILFLCSHCINAQNVSLQIACQLPSYLNEASGIELSSDGTFWTHNDSGNEAKIYQVDDQCNVIRIVNLLGVTNNDWEDLALSDSAILYVGDFGNNANDRTNLAIYYFSTSYLPLGESYVSPSIIHFNHSEQTTFPPQADAMHFDTEAMILRGDSLFLFSKDRSSPFTGITYEYAIPANAGSYTISRIDSFVVSTQGGSAVTSADFLSDINRLYLLTTSEILEFNTNLGNKLFENLYARHSFDFLSQKEGISLLDSCNIYVCDEMNTVLGNGGNIYSSFNCTNLSQDQIVHEEFRVTQSESNDVITIQTSDSQSSESQNQITVFSMEGKKVLDSKGHLPLNIALDNIKTGLYIINIQNDSAFFSSKIYIARSN
jgi:hypothetical protein